MPHPRLGAGPPRADRPQGPCGARGHERTKDLEPGWYIGKIKLYGVSEACKKACPSANFLVKYTKKETGSALEGDEALELTKANYGRDEWWLLLEPSAA